MQIEFIFAALGDKTDHNKEKERIIGTKGQPLPSTLSVGKTSISPQLKFKCYLCSKLLPTKSDLIKHLNLTHNGQPKKLVCEDCDQICTHYAMLNKHKETEHDIYLCARCNIAFYEEKNPW